MSEYSIGLDDLVEVSTPDIPPNNDALVCETCGDMFEHTGRGRKPKTCPTCSVVFQPKSSRTVYCGATCANTAHSTRMLGTGNSNYKDGSSYSLWFSLARKLVLERDARCVACGATQNLHCHHIDHDPKNNRVENLVMLCGTCHIGHHKSVTTRLPWLSTYAQAVSRSMTFRWKKQAASLLTRFSSATA